MKGHGLFALLALASLGCSREQVVPAGVVRATAPDAVGQPGSFTDPTRPQFTDPTRPQFTDPTRPQFGGAVGNSGGGK